MGLERDTLGLKFRQREELIERPDFSMINSGRKTRVAGGVSKGDEV